MYVCMIKYLQTLMILSLERSRANLLPQISSSSRLWVDGWVVGGECVDNFVCICILFHFFPSPASSSNVISTESLANSLTTSISFQTLVIINCHQIPVKGNPLAALPRLLKIYRQHALVVDILTTDVEMP
ncbi:unnamed protein product [Ceratitis capitata]|uniref:(Mediterranean fruit fly) hypothetical protein n=1 Tax=Ceratitis capitata TaxID=7213 RepID=A0A811UVM6_CERCA|nr:unnamed protein product [Ceratitis capitata]